MRNGIILNCGAMMLIMIIIGSCSTNLPSCNDQGAEFRYKSDFNETIFVLDKNEEVFRLTGKSNSPSDIGGRIQDCSISEIRCYSFGPAISIPVKKNIDKWIIHGASCQSHRKSDGKVIEVSCLSPDLSAKFGYDLDPQLNLESFYVSPLDGSINSYRKDGKCGLPFKTYKLKL
jgi:hypothetical protein